MQDPVSSLRDAAVDHLAAGRPSQAIAAYEALLRVTPGEPDDWFNLAYLQRLQRDFEAALVSYDRARLLGAVGPEEIYLNRAVILAEDLRRPDEAMTELE